MWYYIHVAAELVPLLRWKCYFWFKPSLLNFDFGWSPLPLANSWLSAKPDHSFWSSILRYLCSTKNSSIENVWLRHCMWFYGLAPPQLKILAMPMHGGERVVLWAVPFPSYCLWPQASVNLLRRCAHYCTVPTDACGLRRSDADILLLNFQKILNFLHLCLVKSPNCFPGKFCSCE